MLPTIRTAVSRMSFASGRRRALSSSHKVGEINAIPTTTTTTTTTTATANSTTTTPTAPNNQPTINKSSFASIMSLVREQDIEEKFISGSGPGGQCVNKSVNCCQIKHIPTGIVIKVHHTRNLERNRKIARELLAQRLDDLYNGDQSVANKKKQIALHKISVREAQAERRRMMKKQFKRTLSVSSDGSVGGDQ